MEISSSDTFRDTKKAQEEIKNKLINLFVDPI